LRQTGTKETRIRTLWEAHLSESTLLGELTNRQLEEVLQRLGLRISGAKHARIERIVAYFELAIPTGAIENEPREPLKVAEPIEHYRDPDVIANQAEFRRRASNPQASLQPWLDQLLNAHGSVRCYATEDSNPTKQLKNKLSQAAAAHDGVLVLLLSDVDAYTKAREALVERWMANSEWSKSVACIALAYPLGEPTIPLIVERAQNTWAGILRSKIFPAAEIIRVMADKTTPSNPRCTKCSAELPNMARFCPNCGSSVKLQDGSET
jgi:ribosomal protein L40E